MKRFSLWMLFFVVIGSVAIIVWSRQVTVSMPTIRVQLQWFDQSQFAGFYVAEARKYYEEEGIRVELIPGGYQVNPVQRVVTDTADIGIATGDQVLLAKANGQQIKAFGTVFNHSMACFMSKKQAGIETPTDFIGKKVGVYTGFDTENILLAMLSKQSIPSGKVDIVPAGAIEAFVSDELNVFPSYIFNEPEQMKLKNIDVNCLSPEKFGVRFYSDTLFSTDTYLMKNRELIKKFIRASAKGWIAAKQAPLDAIEDMFRSRRNIPSTSRALELRKLNVILDNIGAGPDGQIFFMERSTWDEMEGSLKSIAKLNTNNHIQDLCDFQLVPESAK